MVEDIPDTILPANWVDLDLSSFSQDKTLWDYQQRALQNALKALWNYYEDFADYQPGEDLKTGSDRKRQL